MKEYQMSEEDYELIIEACRPIPLIAIHCGTGPSRQEMVNRAWETLGDKMGFDYMTVKPSKKGRLFFEAEEKK